MSQHKLRRGVRNRLLRADGHLRGVVKMIDEDKECPDILLQIAAVKAALEKASVLILEDHIEHCLTEAVRSGDADRQMEELRAALRKII